MILMIPNWVYTEDLLRNTLCSNRFQGELRHFHSLYTVIHSLSTGKMPFIFSNDGKALLVFISTGKIPVEKRNSVKFGR